MLRLSAKIIGAGFRTARRHAILRALVDEIGEQCEIGVVRNNIVSYVDSVRVPAPAGLQFDPGGRAPIHCTSTGKIFMSRLALGARKALVHSMSLIAYTDTTITDPEVLLSELEDTRQRGWTKTNQEFVKGVVGCAVPIVLADDTLIACLGISVPIARVEFDELDRFIPPMTAAAARLAETVADTEENEDGENPAPGAGDLSSAA